MCFSNRGYERHVTTDFEQLSEYCIGCGACAQVCPTGAIKMEDKGNERKRYTWGQVFSRFKLEGCEDCGRPLAPQKYLDYINEKNYQPLGLELKHKLCPECARKSSAQDVTGILAMNW